MSRTARLVNPLLLTGLMILPEALLPDEIRLAVASNFAPAMKTLVSRFEQESGHEVRLSFGSTGKQYAQIINGAPFDAFFAADTARPERLEAEGQAIAGSRFTYARGKLVLWSPDPGKVDAEGHVLSRDSFRFLAIANPKLAPYGEAARQVLQHLELWVGLEPRLVRGENIGQAFQFVRSGNADLGFVAWSQLVAANLVNTGSNWSVPALLHDPIDQQAVRMSKREAVGDFIAFVRSTEGQAIIIQNGYEIPDVD